MPLASGCGSANHSAHGRGPPLRAPVGGWRLARVQIAGDLAQALPFRVLCLNSKDELVGDGGRSSRRHRLRAPSGRPAPLLHDPRELVDRDEPRPPGHIDGLEQREYPPVEGRSAQPESLSSLRPGICQLLDLWRLVNNECGGATRPGRGRRVPLRFLPFAPLSAPGHAYNRTQTPTVLHLWCICVSPAIGVSSCCTPEVIAGAVRSRCLGCGRARG
jgi:hypothetical protein